VRPSPVNVVDITGVSRPVLCAGAVHDCVMRACASHDRVACTCCGVRLLCMLTLCSLALPMLGLRAPAVRALAVRFRAVRFRVVAPFLACVGRVFFTPKGTNFQKCPCRDIFGSCHTGSVLQMFQHRPKNVVRFARGIVLETLICASTEDNYSKHPGWIEALRGGVEENPLKSCLSVSRVE